MLYYSQTTKTAFLTSGSKDLNLRRPFTKKKIGKKLQEMHYATIGRFQEFN